MVPDYLDRQKVVGVLRGGLGNQLFQLVGYLAYARQRGAPLVLDTSTYSHPSQVGLGRKVEIGTLLVELGVQTKASTKPLDVRVKVALQTGLRLALDSLPHLPFLPVMASDQPLGKTVSNSDVLLRYIDGYFSETVRDPFFADAYSHVLSLLINPPEGAHNPPRAFLKRSVNVHLRLGDTKLKSGEPGFDLDAMICTLSTLEVEGDEVFLHSDEPELARRLLLSRGIRAKCEPTRDSVMDNLLALSRCDVLVCSPSTFSFWAGLVASRLGSTVLFPRSGLSRLIEVPENWRLY